MRYANLINIHLVRNNKDSKNTVVPSIAIRDCIDKKHNKLINLPLIIPIIVKSQKYYRDKDNIGKLGGIC